MKRSALLSLVLLIPAPSIGVLFGMMYFAGTPIGQGVFLLSKIWLFLFPVVWLFVIEKKRPAKVRTAPGGFRMGLISGLAISGFVLGAAILMGRHYIDGDFFRDMMTQAGLNKKTVYVGAMLYWIFINSVLEEYVWRWFVVRQFSVLCKPTGAILLSAAGFTLHHILAMQVYFSWSLSLACALFIFIGGTWWSWMFLRYKTIWPGWLSHALVDIAVFGYGYTLIF